MMKRPSSLQPSELKSGQLAIIACGVADPASPGPSFQQNQSQDKEHQHRSQLGGNGYGCPMPSQVR
jgi:hypothetical protein